MTKLNEQQRYALRILKGWIAEGYIPSGHLRRRGLLNPGPLLRRLEARGLVESNGVVMPEGRVYRITAAGVAAVGVAAESAR